MYTSSASFPSSFPLVASTAGSRFPRISQHLHGCVEIVFSEVPLQKGMHAYRKYCKWIAPYDASTGEKK